MNTDKNAVLYEKMAAEQDKFRDWLKSQPPEEILKHTYEYTVREDILMALLPFRSLAITGMKDLPGTYVTILASEDRSKELRQRRPSVRRQLKQEPRPAEKKAHIHKKKEPER